jgi:hypothetical protein
MYNYLLGSNGLGSCCIRKEGGGIGDSLMLEYSVSYLRKYFPDADIYVAYGTEEEAKYFEGLEVEYTDFREFDYVVDVSTCATWYERAGLSSKSRIDIYKEKLGCSSVEIPALFMSRVFVPYNYIALDIASRDPNRCWDEDNYIKLIRRFPDLNFVILDDQYNLEEIAFLIEGAKYFIGPDSLFMHMAGVLGTPGLILFGPSVPETQLSYYPFLEWITAKHCIHCWHSKCLLNRNCMSSITVEQVSGRLHSNLPFLLGDDKWQ